MPVGIYLRTEKHKKMVSDSLKKYFRENGRSEEWCKHISERTFTNTWREKISHKMRKRKLSLEHRQKIGLGLTGRLVEEATRKKIALSLNGHPVSQQTRNKISVIQLRQFRNGERLPNTHAFSAEWFCTNSGILVRSSWELFVCNLLTKFNIEWQYEPKVFDLGFASYRPDLYLLEYDLWVEIKGYWRNGEKAKVDAFSLTHSLLLIDESKYKQLVKDNSLIIGWLVCMR